ncbi:hypothetical protein ASF28_11385 [Methylobacterium sp. Leaf99]|nr:hypothetical protein ASF28_11385 [Methylobacterium sp. Leaf99]
MKLESSQTFIISREEAAERDHSRFRTGRPCKAGHLAERYVSNRQCVACNIHEARMRERRRSQDDPSYRMYRNVQRRTGQVLKGRHSPKEALKCNLATLREHISSRFKAGMVWAQYGQWEVDHIVPLSAAKSEVELIELCQFTNLQPLWKRENQKKGGA